MEVVMGKLDGKIALVTGGTTGIGLAAARLFQQEGAQVYVTGRSEAKLAEVKRQLPGVVALRSDAAELGDIDRLATEIERRSGRLDVLFINAGIAKFQPIQQVTPALLDEMFDINFRGPYFTVQRLLPLMPSGASIVLTTSVAADLGFEHSSVYAASKAALSSLARTLSNELSPKGIRVNEVSPGPIETPIFGTMGLTPDQESGFKQTMAGMVPLKRLGTSEEVAKAVLYLASADSSFLLGAKIRIDGGLALN
jgi:NAD(P)-dependent dehydrogenase (short-subunit alcohol dehydrogenase family)